MPQTTQAIPNDNAKTLKAFYAALENHDWNAARALLHDDFRFRAPSQQADSAESFIATNQQLNPDWKFRDIEMIEQADAVLSFFTTVMTRPAQGTNRCAERVVIKNGKLQSIELIYDNAGFRPQITASETVSEYLHAFYSGDFDKAKALVADDFHFKGPFVEATDKETFFKSAAPLAQIVKGHRLLRQWTDGGEVCSIFDVNLETPAGKGSLTMSEWSTVRNGKLNSGRVILDTAAFRALVPAR